MCERCLGSLLDSRDVHGNRNANMPKMRMEMGKVHVTVGMIMATFSFVPKFPSIGRLDANAVCDSDILKLRQLSFCILSIYRRLIIQ